MDQGKPRRPDPAGIHSDPVSRDWRSWTIEVRSLEDVDLSTVLGRDGIEAWAIDPQLEARLRQRVHAGDTFPWWEALMRSSARRVEASGATIQELFVRIDEEVRDRCLL